MPSAGFVAWLSILIPLLIGFATVLIKLGAMQQQIALLWAWYLSECGPGVPGGRRRTDPPAHFQYNDQAGAISGPDDTASHHRA